MPICFFYCHILNTIDLYPNVKLQSDFQKENENILMRYVTVVYELGI